MGVHVECICCGVYNNRVDSKGVEIQLQQRRRNHGPTHAIHTQNPTSPSLNGFESNSNSGNGASNSGDGSCPTLLISTHDNDDFDTNLCPPSKKIRTS